MDKESIWFLVLIPDKNRCLYNTGKEGLNRMLTLVKGFVFLDHISWDAFNESSHLLKSVENYKKRFGFYPYEVLADQIYCTRENRKLLKEKNIKLVAKPLGRPSATAVKNHIRPGGVTCKGLILNCFNAEKRRETQYSVTGFLPQHASSATTLYGACGTMYRRQKCLLKGGDALQVLGVSLSIGLGKLAWAN